MASFQGWVDGERASAQGVSERHDFVARCTGNQSRIDNILLRRCHDAKCLHSINMPRSIYFPFRPQGIVSLRIIISAKWTKWIGGDTACNCFHRIVRPSRVPRSEPINQTVRLGALNAYSSRTVKARDIQTWRACFQGQSGYDPRQPCSDSCATFTMVVHESFNTLHAGWLFFHTSTVIS